MNETWRETDRVGVLDLLKYEAVGNDFLLFVDWQKGRTFDAALAVTLCDRHRGVGADGLIRISRPHAGGSLRMDLLNADGSAAETSGNGMRCAVLCSVDEGIVPPGELLIETVVGRVPASIDAARSEDERTVRVEMGIVALNELSSSPLEGRRAFAVDTGNPHLVLIGESNDDVDLSFLGPELSSGVPEGRNVEIVAKSKGDDELDLAVYERGVGITLACGSGSVAAAAAARSIGVVGGSVIVHNPGGDLLVELAEARSGFEATLVGPARRVARVIVDEDDLLTKATLA